MQRLRDLEDSTKATLSCSPTAVFVVVAVCILLREALEETAESQEESSSSCSRRLAIVVNFLTRQTVKYTLKEGLAAQQNYEGILKGMRWDVIHSLFHDTSRKTETQSFHTSRCYCQVVVIVKGKTERTVFLETAADTVLSSSSIVHHHRGSEIHKTCFPTTTSKLAAIPKK